MISCPQKTAPEERLVQQIVTCSRTGGHDAENCSGAVFTWLVIVSQALGQATTAPATPTPVQPGPATPTQTAGSGVNGLWLLVIAALIAAALWYFMHPRGTPRL